MIDCSVSINAVRGLLGKPKGSVSPLLLHDQPLIFIPTMTLTRAVHLLDAAGWTKGFTEVTLKKPEYPGIHHVEYIFAMVGAKIVAVDAVTGVVSG